jgi:DNA-directed RNA polymerase specialized sigma24 family protein
MAKENILTQENFDVLLCWLDLNREAAGKKYEKIRERLVRIFVGRGCFEAEELADETINRVANILPRLIDNYTGEQAYYFYGVADKVHLEWLRKEKKKKTLEMPNRDGDEDELFEMEYECLESCLEKLTVNVRELIVEYYRKDRRAKIEHRKNLAERLSLTMGALQIKTCRIRAGLLKCIKDCVAAKAS